MRTSAHEQDTDAHQPRLGSCCEVFGCCDLCGPTMLAHLQVGLSQILAPDYGRRLRSFSVTMQAKGKTLPESGTRHRSVGGAMPICVYTQKS